MAYCKKCGTDRPDGARFCAACGSRLARERDSNGVDVTSFSHYHLTSVSHIPPSTDHEWRGDSRTSKKVQMICQGCGLPLTDAQIETNIRAQRTDRSNLGTFLMTFLIAVVGAVLMLISTSHLQLNSPLLDQWLFYILLLGIALMAFPFVFMAWKRDGFFKKADHIQFYCSRCSNEIRRIDEARSEDGTSSSVRLPEGSRRFMNDLESNDRKFMLTVAALMVPGLIFGWFYGTYIKGMSFQSNLLFTLIMVALLAGIIVFANSRSPTPRAVEIMPESVVFEMKNGKRKTAPFYKITWLNVVMDGRQIKDLPNASGSIYVGPNGILEMRYTVKREIAIELREAYRARTGSYPKNGYETADRPKKK